jgi:DNA repair exonuclease SbcCD ATPase subunit
MYNFDTLQLVNYLLWDDLEFKFEEGITYITGENGSGKSTLFSSLGPLLYNTDFVPKNSRATLSLHTAKNNYDFTVLNSGKSRNRYEAAIDGKQQKAERIDDGRRIIEKHFGTNIQESLFKTTMFINGRKEHPLAEGKPADRLDWVHETLAYASILDAYLDRVDSKMKAAKDDSIRYGMTVDQIKGLSSVEEPTEDVEELRQKAAKITKKIRELEKQKSTAEYALRYKESVTDTPKISVKEAQATYDKYNTLYMRLLKQKEQFDTQQERIEQRDKVRSKLTDFKQEYKSLCKKLKQPMINPKNMRKIAEDSLEKAEKFLVKAREDNETYEEQSDLRAFLSKHRDRTIKDSRKDIKSKLDKVEKQYHVTQLMINAHESGDEHCSVCGSDFKNSNHNVKELKTTNKKRSERIKQYQLDLKIIKARSEDVISQKKDLDELKEQVTFCKKMRDVCTSYLQTLQQAKTFNDIAEVESVDSDKLNKVERKYKVAQKTLVQAQTDRSILKRFEDIEQNEYASKTKKELRDLVESFDNSIRALYKKQRVINDNLINTETTAALYKKYRRDKRDLLDKAKELSTAARDYKLLAVAKKALGRDGFRTKRLQSTLELFVDNLNDLAPLVWKKPYKFEIITGPRKCDAIVHRNGQVGTAQSLSGAEQRCWQAVAALAMLRLLPDNRRCNTIILDEIDANTDEHVRQRLMSDLLPEIQKTVPNVIIISPRSTKELFIQADRSYKVVSKGSRSKLIET